MLSYCCHILIFQIVIAGSTGNLSFAFLVIAGSTGNLCIIRCPIRSGMTSINELSEFRTDDEFLMVALFHAAHYLGVYAEAL